MTGWTVFWLATAALFGAVTLLGRTRQTASFAVAAGAAAGIAHGGGPIVLQWTVYALASVTGYVLIDRVIKRIRRLSRLTR